MKRIHKQKFPPIDLDPDIERRLHAYQSIHPNESCDQIASGGPKYLENNDPDQDHFWLFCALAEVRRHEGNEFGYLYLAEALLANRRITEAKAIYQLMLDSGFKFNGYYDDPRFHLAWLEADARNYDGAMQHLNECARQYRNPAIELEAYRGIISHMAGEFSRAVRHYTKYLEGAGQAASGTIRAYMTDAGERRAWKGQWSWPLPV